MTTARTDAYQAARIEAAENAIYECFKRNENPYLNSPEMNLGLEKRENMSGQYAKSALEAADAVPVPQDDAMIERVATAIAWDCFHLGVKSLSGLDAIARAAISAMQPKAEG